MQQQPFNFPIAVPTHISGKGAFPVPVEMRAKVRESQSRRRGLVVTLAQPGIDPANRGKAYRVAELRLGMN